MLILIGDEALGEYFGLSRFGFNGKEKDDSGEWGSQTHYDYGFRIYNPSIGKFLSVDPLTASYPHYTPYQYAGNNPIRFIDLDGAERADHGKNYSSWDFWEWFENWIFGGASPSNTPNSEEEYYSNTRRAQDFQKGHDIVKEHAEFYHEAYSTIVPGYDAVLQVSQGALVGATIYAAVDIGGGKVLKPVSKVLKPGVQFLYKWGGGQIDNLVSISYKYSGKIKDLVTGTGQVNGKGEIFTALNDATLDNGLKVVGDILGDLGDDAANVIGKEGRGMFQGKITGKQAADGSSGYRLDYDPEKGAHINWWTADKKGAVLIDTTEDVMKKALDNEVIK